MTSVDLGSQARRHRAPHLGYSPDRWGYVRVGYARHWVHHRLVMYPPGATDEDRRVVRIWVSAHIWAPAIWLAVFACAAALGDQAPWPAGIATAITATLLLISTARAWKPKSQLRILVSWTGTGCGFDELDRYHRLTRIVSVLRRADDDLRAGAISAAGHELIWARCYEELA